MKKVLCFFIILSLFPLLLHACSQSERTNIDKEDLVIEINGKSFSLNSDASLLLNELGDVYEMSEAPSCVYIGTDKQFDYSYISIYTYPVEDKDLIDEIILTDNTYKTKRGITVGATAEEVKKTYGDNFVEEEGLLTYVLEPDNPKSPSIYFVMDNNTVSSISLYSASNMP